MCTCRMCAACPAQELSQRASVGGQSRRDHSVGLSWEAAHRVLCAPQSSLESTTLSDLELATASLLRRLLPPFLLRILNGKVIYSVKQPPTGYGVVEFCF